MLSDARGLPQDARLDADVCVVGGGAAGITLALELRDSGLRTVVLDSGGRTGPHPETQRLYEGESVGRRVGSVKDDLGLDDIRLRWLGGTTNHWAGYCRKLEPVDFEEREHLEVSGWPITKADLEPFWQRAALWCRIRDASDDPDVWRRRIGASALPATPVVHTRVFQITPFLRFGEAYEPELRSFDDVETVLWANVVDLDTPDGRRVERARVLTLTGNRAEVRAKAFVLAVGGIENPRLLLASTGADPSGLGNRFDQVGRYFCEHLQTPAGFGALTATREDLSGYVGVERSLADGPYAGSHYGVKYTLALTSEHVRGSDGLGLEVQLLAEPLPVGVPQQPRGLSAVEMADLVALTAERPAPTGAYLHALAEQRLRADSRVTLADGRDALGMRRVRLDWRYGASERAALLSGLRAMAEELGAQGLGRLQVIPGGVTLGTAHFFDPQGLINLFAVDLDSVDPDDFRIGIGYHHMCTTRMSERPTDGVVDPDCRVHGMENLWVAGSSVFATGGVATPTFTIVALAVRLADHLRELLV